MSSLVFRLLSNSLLFRPVRYISSIKLEESRRKQDEDVQVVCTTGYSFVGVDGQTVAKYGVYWGANDERNMLEELRDGSTYLTAMIKAIVEALRIVSYSGLHSKLLIKTDWKVNDDYMKLLNLWNERQFRSLSGVRMKNADLLEEMYHITRDVDVEFEYKASLEDRKNYVTEAIIADKKAKYINASDIKDGDERDSEGKKPTTSSVDWPVVYVGASYRLFHSGFVLASYATHWPISECGEGTVHRLTKPTTTLFKAQLIGIEKALTQALDYRLPRVVVVTDNRKFLHFWENGWIKSDGNFVVNKDMFDRIELLIRSFKEIRFRFEPFTKNSMEWLSVKAKCEEGIKFPILWKDKSEYRLSIGKIVSQNYSETTNLQRVRIFKNNTIRRNVVWENMDGESAVNTNANHEITVKTLHSALISALTKAVELNLSSLIVRTDSRRLIRACESWLPVWERNEWRNSLNKPVAYCDEWKTIYALKKKIKIYWELMDPFTDEDFKAASFLQPPKSIKTDNVL